MKKLLISFLLGLTVFFSFAPYLSPAKAQTWYNQSFQEWYGKVYDPANPSEIFGERYTAAQVQWIVYGLFGFLVNTVTGPQNSALIQCFISNVVNVDTCVTQLKTALTADNGRGQILATVKPQLKQNLWSLVFASNRPISGIAYVENVLHKLSPVGVVQAQTVGTGFNALKPIQPMWTAFRNVSFGLFVIVAVVFAFMIMFRVKLSPQTVVSVQSALPKIVVSLILVTFSYAIAGFLIDLMYVVIGLVSLIGTQFISGIDAPRLFNLLTLGQPANINVQLGVFGLLAIYLVFFCFALFGALMVNVGLVGTAVIGIGVALLATAIWPILLIIAVVIFIILAVVAIWMLIKIIWGLLKAFANVLLLTVIAPLQLTLGAVIPSLSFGAWVKSYVSNLAVFVVTGVLIMFSYIFLFMGCATALQANIWEWLFGSGAMGSLTGLIVQGTGDNINAWPPLLGVGGNPGVGLLFIMVSFVIFTMIPKANELIQAFLSGKPFAYGTAMGEAFGPVNAAWGKTENFRKYAGDRATSEAFANLNARIKKGGALSRIIPKVGQDYIEGRGTKAGTGDFTRKY